MQIVTLDLNSGDLCGIEPVLRSLADSVDPLAVAKGGMFLTLTRHLRVSGQEPRLVGLLFFNELTLWPEGGEAPATVTIRPDWFDFGPRVGELPQMHYRVDIRSKDRVLTRDIRTQELERVERAMREAFGWDG